jgi:hypothetical protein
MRIFLATLLFAVAGVLAVNLEPGGTRPVDAAVARPVTPTPDTVEVAFVRNGRLVRVDRVVPRGVRPEAYALRELVRGPRPDERLRGLTSALGKHVRVRSIRPDGDLWRLSLSRSLFRSGNAETLRMRLRQIEVTLTPLGPEAYAALAAEGRFVTLIRLGAPPPLLRAKTGEKGFPYSVQGVQLRLWTLGYLARPTVSGTLDYATEQALLAFQGWESLYRSGTVTGGTQLALLRAERPRPARTGGGEWIEIHRDQGVLLEVDGGTVLRAVHTSTGAYGRTPAGDFRVYRKELLSWSQPFHVWMPYASYFTGGIAMHEYPDVPGYPASHGCVRLPDGDALRVYAFAQLGMPVYVY